MSYTLVDATEVARGHPETFKLPHEEDTTTLHPGDFAKLCFKFESDGHSPDGERMWVQVMAVYACGHYMGRLSNDPIYAPLRLGEEVDFAARHVLAFMRKESATTGKEDIDLIGHDRNDPKKHEK